MTMHSISHSDSASYPLYMPLPLRSKTSAKDSCEFFLLRRDPINPYSVIDGKLELRGSNLGPFVFVVKLLGLHDGKLLAVPIALPEEDLIGYMIDLGKQYFFKHCNSPNDYEKISPDSYHALLDRFRSI